MHHPIREVCRWIAAAVVLGSTGAISAAPLTIAADTFETAVHPTGDRLSATGTGLVWFTRSGTTVGTAAIADDTGANGLGSMALAVTDIDNSSSTSMPVLAPLPSTVTLANVGDSVTLSFRFRYTNNGAINSTGVNQFRFGLHSSAGTVVDADNQSNSDNDVGYYAALGSGGQTPTISQIFYEETGGTANILGGNDRTAKDASASTGTGINDNLVHTASLTLTRTSDVAVGFSLVIDGGAAITGSDGATPRTSFDQIAIGGGFGTTGNAYLVDDVTVTAIVPEPACLGLLAMAALLCGRRRHASNA